MEQLPTDAFLQQQRFTRATHRDIYPFIAPTAPSLSQANRIIAITGASQGLGHLAFAHSFALAGAKALILGARNVEKLEKVKAELDGEFPKTEVVALRLDVRNEESQEAFWKVVSERWGRADVVICNAGVDPGMKTVKEIEGAVWWDAMETNLKGLFLTSQHFLGLLPSAPSELTTPNPTIIDVSSGFAVLPPVPGFSTNAISKLAGVQLCAYIAAEHPEVTVVALHPGIVHTNIVDTAFSWAKHMALDTHELVGGTAVFLSTPAAHFLSGRFVTANWDMEELVQRQDEIVREDKLRMFCKGQFGPQQFQ